MTVIDPTTTPPTPLPVEETPPDVLVIPPDPPAPTTPEGGRTFTAEEIEKARREEKDKLYGSMEEMKKELAALRKAREAQEKAEADARKKAEEDTAKAEAAAKKKAEDEMELRGLLTTKEQEWEQRFQALEAEREMERELLNKERRYGQLRDYRTSRIEAEQEEIMPQLRDLIATGPDEAAIEASIVTMKERTEQIVGQINAHTAQTRQQQKGSTVTAPPVGPLESQPENLNLTAADLKNMDIDTYAKYRDRLMGAVSQQVRQRGPYGG